MRLPTRVFVLLADAGEFEDGAEIAPVSCQCAGDRGLRLHDPLVFFRVVVIHRFVAEFLSLLRSWIVLGFRPTACAVGCGLSPLCGWFCRCAFLGRILLSGLRIGLGLLDSFVFSLVVVIRGFVAGFLSLLRSWVVFCFCPTACAVGCALSPLRGWFCRCAFLGRVSLSGLRIGLGLDLDYAVGGLADRNVRATRAGAALLLWVAGESGFYYGDVPAFCGACDCCVCRRTG